MTAPKLPNRGSTLTLLCHTLLQQLAKETHMVGADYQQAMMTLRQLLAKVEIDEYGLMHWNYTRQCETQFIEELYKPSEKSLEFPEDTPETLH